MSTRSPFNAKSPTIKRILREASELSAAPSADYYASPLETNLFEWHFILRGPPSPSPFENGLYHGRIVLPPTYPLRPPSFRFLTPTGRFETNREICLSISGHHEETWQPAWGIRTALVALRAFMDQEAKGQVGGLESDEACRKKLAKESRGWKCSGCGRSNEAIMKAVEDEVAALEKSGAQERRLGSAEEVPAELLLGYRDELESKKRPESVASGSSSSREPSSGGRPPKPAAKLTPSSTPSTLGSPTSAIRRTGSGTAAPPPTRTVPAAVQRPVAVPPASHNGVPPWLDKAIGGVMACLIFFIIKKLMGL